MSRVLEKSNMSHTIATQKSGISLCRVGPLEGKSKCPKSAEPTAKDFPLAGIGGGAQVLSDMNGTFIGVFYVLYP